MDFVKYRNEIATFMGPTWKVNHDAQSIYDGSLEIFLHASEYTKKFDISGRIYSENPEQRNLFHKVLFDWIRSDEREAWTLSIGCGFKSPEKIANDIQRRLIPSLIEMSKEVKRRLAINQAQKDELRSLVDNFKEKVNGIRMRESRGNAERANYYWEATFLTKDYNHLAEVKIYREGPINLTLNGTTVDIAANLIKTHCANKEMIS